MNDALPEHLKQVQTRPLFVMRLNVKPIVVVGPTPPASAASASSPVAPSRATASPASCSTAAATGRRFGATAPRP